MNTPMPPPPPPPRPSGPPKPPHAPAAGECARGGDLQLRARAPGGGARGVHRRRRAARMRSCSREVRALLAAHEARGRLSCKTTRRFRRRSRRELARLKPEEAGERIGPYKLLRADRRGRLRHGLDGGAGASRCGGAWRSRSSSWAWTRKEVIARFEAGAAGAGDDGSSEHRQGARCRRDATAGGRSSSWNWCAGMPITEYCDEAEAADTRERLELFIDVCHGDPARASEGHHPPRHQALEHPRHAARRRAGAEGHRLRHRQGHAGQAHRQDALHPASSS